MQKNDVIEFLEKIDLHMSKNPKSFIKGAKFDFKIIGKSALLLAGLIDTAGTVDIDSLGLDGKTPNTAAQNTIDFLNGSHSIENIRICRFTTLIHTRLSPRSFFLLSHRLPGKKTNRTWWPRSTKEL
jgi:hypothetical protein